MKRESVTLTVELPADIAAQAREVAESDPEFLSRVVLYGLTRRAIYRHLRANEDGAVQEMRVSVFTDDERKVLDEADADGEA